jgi:hypothetical protein
MTFYRFWAVNLHISMVFYICILSRQLLKLCHMAVKSQVMVFNCKMRHFNQIIGKMSRIFLVH